MGTQHEVSAENISKENTPTIFQSENETLGFLEEYLNTKTSKSSIINPTPRTSITLESNCTQEFSEASCSTKGTNQTQLGSGILQSQNVRTTNDVVPTYCRPNVVNENTSQSIVPGHRFTKATTSKSSEMRLTTKRSTISLTSNQSTSLVSRCSEDSLPSASSWSTQETSDGSRVSRSRSNESMNDDNMPRKLNPSSFHSHDIVEGYLNATTYKNSGIRLTAKRSTINLASRSISLESGCSQHSLISDSSWCTEETSEVEHDPSVEYLNELSGSSWTTDGTSKMQQRSQVCHSLRPFLAMYLDKNNELEETFPQTSQNECLNEENSPCCPGN